MTRDIPKYKVASPGRDKSKVKEPTREASTMERIIGYLRSSNSPAARSIPSGVRG